MNDRATGIADWAITETPIAVLDFETTGLTPGSDRVVEVTIARKEPGCPSEIVFDTLINPCRPLVATEIHGIRDEDVVDAPKFEEIAGTVVKHLSGCVFATYNVFFDLKFLLYELSRVGFREEPPSLCLMQLRPMLGMGRRCSLEDACREHKVPYGQGHISSTDVTASCRLLEIYLDVMSKKGIKTYKDLADQKHYRFAESFTRFPFRVRAAESLGRSDRLKSRRHEYADAPAVAKPPAPEKEQRAPSMELRVYWEELKAVLTDLEVSQAELQRLAAKKKLLGLTAEQIRVLHARAFVSVLSQYTDDEWLDAKERDTIRRLYRCLDQLGWAPGQ